MIGYCCFIFHPSFDHFNLQKSCWLQRRCRRRRCRRSYLRSRRLDMTSIITNKLADIPRPETRKMIPAAENGSSWHSMSVLLVPLRSGSPPKIPAPGMPRETVLLPRDMTTRWWLVGLGGSGSKPGFRLECLFVWAEAESLATDPQPPGSRNF